MALILNDIKNEKSFSVSRCFESMGTGLLLLSIHTDPKSQYPYHWFLENNIKPPLDIAIDKDTGQFNSIRFFFQDEKINCIKKIPSCLKSLHGIPLFQVSDFSEDKYQIFEQGNVFAHTKNNDLYLILENHVNSFKSINLCLILSENITFFFDKSNIFIGLCLKDLSISEVSTLELSNLLSPNHTS